METLKIKILSEFLLFVAMWWCNILIFLVHEFSSDFIHFSNQHLFAVKVWRYKLSSTKTSLDGNSYTCCQSTWRPIWCGFCEPFVIFAHNSVIIPIYLGVKKLLFFFHMLTLCWNDNCSGILETCQRYQFYTL